MGFDCLNSEWHSFLFPDRSHLTGVAAALDRTGCTLGRTDDANTGLAVRCKGLVVLCRGLAVHLSEWTGVALDWTGVALQRTGGALDMTVGAIHRTGGVQQLHVLYEGQSLKINSETWNYKIVNLQ